MAETEHDTLDFSEGLEASSTPEDTENTPVEDAGEQQDNAESVDTGESNTNDNTEVESEPEDEDDAFIKREALDPSDPSSLKKMVGRYRNAEKLMNEKSQEAARLQRMLAQAHSGGQANGVQEQNDPTEQLRMEVQTLKNNETVREFRTRVNPTPEVEQKMSQYLTAPMTMPNGQVVSRGQLVSAGMMSLDDVYRLVGGGQIDPTQIKEQVRKQTLAEVASRQNAARIAAGSTNQTEFRQADPDDGFLEGFGG